MTENEVAFDDQALLAGLSDEEIDGYLDIALAVGTRTGFSKGTANVSARDLKKLRPLIKYYAKKPHPFRACVRDNEKRFGKLTNKYCAIIKDLIEGNTKWRNKKKNLSEETLFELFSLEAPRDFFAFLSELTDDEIEEMTLDEENVELAAGDVAWQPEDGFNSLRSKIELALNGEPPESPGGDYAYGGMKFWVEDVSKDKALVCEGGKDYYVVGFTVNKGEVDLAEESDWKPVSRAWVEEKVGLSDEPHLMAEMFFSSKTKAAKADKEGLIWKPIMRSGEWKFSPGSSGAAPKPIKIVKDGKSDKKNLTLSMSELKANFEAGAVEHVTIPASHADTVLENTGFIRKLRFAKDEEGRDVLEAGMDFTEPDVKGKAERGTIANTSAGVLFDYIHKESGKKFRSVLAHAALTNRPWLNGMKPFGVNASDDLEVVGFSEDQIDTSERRETMPEETPEFDFTALGFADEAELRAALEERKSLKAKDRERDVADLCQKWQGEGVAPALVAEAQTIMMSDEGATVLNLSEDNKDVALTASDIVQRLVAASPKIDLSEEQVTDEDASADKPKDGETNEAQLSQEEKTLASQLFFEQGIPMKEAVQKAKEQIAAQSGN